MVVPMLEGQSAASTTKRVSNMQRHGVKVEAQLTIAECTSLGYVKVSRSCRPRQVFADIEAGDRLVARDFRLWIAVHHGTRNDYPRKLQTLLVDARVQKVWTGSVHDSPTVCLGHAPKTVRCVCVTGRFDSSHLSPAHFRRAPRDCHHYSRRRRCWTLRVLIVVANILWAHTQTR